MGGELQNVAVLLRWTAQCVNELSKSISRHLSTAPTVEEQRIPTIRIPPPQLIVLKVISNATNCALSTATWIVTNLCPYLSTVLPSVRRECR
jgi:hypothetical protein